MVDRNPRESKPTVYDLFIEEVEAMTIMADNTAAAVVGILTRAVKRAQMVADGELAPVTVRRAVMREMKDNSDG